MDWTHSPYLAAFFAFSEPHEEPSKPAERRAIYGLSKASVEKMTATIRDAAKKATGSLPKDSAAIVAGSVLPETIEFYKPYTDENKRMISQNGLFTKSPLNIDVEAWVRKYFEGEKKYVKLYKVLFPDSARDIALKSLNRMNINHSTVYPDLNGACLFCNMHMQIKNY